MSRLLPTIVQRIHSEEYSWSSFRRALRKEDQKLFDLLWVYCRRHAQAAAVAERQVPFEPILMTMMMGLLREMVSLKSNASMVSDGEPIYPYEFEGLGQQSHSR